uniref:PID domain-containing protein n=1 Tax=Steinernema glaseri TaxID=37863 RepID=A0A1I8A5U5_9BILA
MTSADGIHRLHYLGAVDMAELVDSGGRSIEEQIVDAVEAAQLGGALPTSGSRLVAVHVSKIGIKLVAEADQAVVDRLALHKIVQALSFDDGFGRANVVLVEKKSSDDVQCHLLQTASGTEADHLCRQIRQAFHSAVVDSS